MEEIWKPIEGYEGLYEISNLGRVKSFDRIDSMGRLKKGKILKPNKINKGYLVVILYKDGKGKNNLIHRLVASTFIPNPNNKPEVDHINTITYDNRVENLRWCTQKENNNNPISLLHKSEGGKRSWEGEINRQHMMEGSKKRKKPIAQCDLQRNLIRYWDSTADAEKELGFSSSLINRCLKGRNKSAYGYRWMYKDYYDIREQIRLGMNIRKGVA